MNFYLARECICYLHRHLKIWNFPRDATDTPLLCRLWTQPYLIMMLKVLGRILLMNLLNTWTKITLSRRVTWTILPGNDGLLWCRLCDWLIFNLLVDWAMSDCDWILYIANRSPSLHISSPATVSLFPQHKVVKKSGREMKDLTSWKSDLFSLETHLVKIHTLVVMEDVIWEIWYCPIFLWDKCELWLALLMFQISR